jgi:hypothetical protein
MIVPSCRKLVEGERASQESAGALVIQLKNRSFAGAQDDSSNQVPAFKNRRGFTQ